MSFRLASFQSFVSSMLTKLENTEHWRAGVPINAEAFDQWQLPPHLNSWVDARLECLRELANRLNHRDFHRWWLEELARLPGTSALAPARPNTWARATRMPELHLRCSVDDHDETSGLVIVAGQRRVRLPPYIEPFVKALVRLDTFTPSELYELGRTHEVEPDECNALIHILYTCGLWEMQP